MTLLAPLVTAFFRKHLAAEKGVSKNTINSYSYAFKFLCGYVSDRVQRVRAGYFAHPSTIQELALAVNRPRAESREGFRGA